MRPRSPWSHPIDTPSIGYIPTLCYVRHMTTADGRRTRWEGHRTARREALLDAAVRAIRLHGAGVGMDEIAATAGTSKAVVYRHFTDRTGLHRALCDRVGASILLDIRLAMGEVPSPEHSLAPKEDARRSVAATIDAYLALVERDPQLYRFVSAPPAGAPDLTAALVATIAAQVETGLGPALDARGESPGTASIWAHALVGMVRAAADAWLADEAPAPRSSLTRTLTDLLWSGLVGLWPAARESENGSVVPDVQL